jgi:hypothetical protein
MMWSKYPLIKQRRTVVLSLNVERISKAISACQCISMLETQHPLTFFQRSPTHLLRRLIPSLILKYLRQIVDAGQYG